ncbi:MAG: VWA domain-containing protein [Treponema sp.]|nr:VWA domain-containing protein [Candidatus Treponema equifaecale]
MKKFVFGVLIFLCAFSCFSAKKSKKVVVQKDYDLLLTQDDILVLPEDSEHLVMDGNGAHLFVKKRGDIQSISLLIENDNYNDPDLSLMRAKVPNSVNGKEVRYTYGNSSKFKNERTPNPLASSTVEIHEILGECFHIYVPKEMYYGYVIQVQGECTFENGMTVNVRTFSEKFCDTIGKWADNHLSLILTDLEKEKAFSEIAEIGDGEVFHIIKQGELAEKLEEEIEELDCAEKIDLVFAIDATESMKDDFVELREQWLPIFNEQMKEFKNIRLGLLFYKDYGDEFKTKGLPVKIFSFTKSASSFSKNIKNVSVKGGGDREEAVYEALYSCGDGFKWKSDAVKKVILIGDAGPHPLNESKFNKGFEEISELLKEKGISVDCFLISDFNSGEKTELKEIAKETVSKELETSVDELKPILDSK